MGDYSTYEGCLAAVQQDGDLLYYVPKEKKTHEICLAAVQQNGYALQFVPDENNTPEICLVAIQQDGYALLYVPTVMMTHEICLAAVQRNGRALQFVPEYFQSDEIIEIALDNNPEAYKYIKNKKTITIHHAEPKQMPDKAYDTLQMGYDEETAIQDGELMVDFHNEFDYGRLYRKATFEKFILPRKKNLYTDVAIREYTIYQAKV